jgi:hypothetical protein
MSEFRSENDKKIEEYADNIQIVNGSVKNMNGGPLSHSCMKSNSFPRLILF